MAPIDFLSEKRHGMNGQVLADAADRLGWASSALPGAVHDLTAARTHGLMCTITTLRTPAAVAALGSTPILSAPAWADLPKPAPASSPSRSLRPTPRAPAKTLWSDLQSDAAMSSAWPSAEAAKGVWDVFWWGRYWDDGAS
jgi:hypothetical protein